MAELTMVVGGTGVLVAEVDDADVGPAANDLGLASLPGGKIAARAAVSLEEALDQLEPALQALSERLRRAAPDAVSIEFGLKLGGETGVILAKGTAEVNFKVSLSWTGGGA
jgi:hypothetical protein